jgi:hypothetical protein
MLSVEFMLESRFVTGAAAALVLLSTPRARAQEIAPPETLEAPYEEPAATDRARPPSALPAAPYEPPPPLEPLPSPVQGSDESPLLPIRAQRRLALMGEVGWNGIAGFGPTLTFHAHPHLSFDFGAGFSLTGWKLGIRSRFNLLEGRVTPFVGAGLMATAGLGEFALDAEEADPAEEALTIRVEPSAFAQTVVGVDWTSRGGFTLVGAIGYAFLLNNDNVDILAGVPTSEEAEAIDVLFRSSAVFTLAIGHSFD